LGIQARLWKESEKAVRGRVFATCSQQEPYGVMEEEEEGDGEERVSVRGAGAKQEEEDVEERS